MQDDEDKRFPRITLGQFLDALFRPIFRLILMGPLAIVEALFGGGDNPPRKPKDDEERKPDDR